MAFKLEQRLAPAVPRCHQHHVGRDRHYDSSLRGTQPENDSDREEGGFILG